MLWFSDGFYGGWGCEGSRRSWKWIGGGEDRAVDYGDDVSGSAWPRRHRSCDAGTPLDHLRLQLVCKKKLIWKRYMYKREITKSNKIAWLSLCFILERSWVALYSDVCQCVRHRCHPTKSPLFPIYTGIQALCWLNTIYKGIKALFWVTHSILGLVLTAFKVYVHWPADIVFRIVVSQLFDINTRQLSSWSFWQYVLGPTPTEK